MPGTDDELELDLELDDGQEAEDAHEGEGHEDGGEDAEGHERVVAQGQDGDDEDEGQARQVSRQPRGREAERLRTLRNENKQLAAEQARLQRDLDELKRGQQNRQEDPALEQQRLAIMTPEERTEYRFQKAEERSQREMQALKRQMLESGDRAAFGITQANDAVAKRYAPKVEQLFQQEFAKGNFVSREVLLNYVVGEALRAKAAVGAPKQRQQAQRRVAQQQTRPTNGRADVQTNRRGGQSLADKLSDVII